MNIMKFLSFLGKEKEKREETLKLYYKLSALALEMGNLFFECTRAWLEEDFSEVERLEQEINKKESEGDNLVRNITHNLFGGVFLPWTRGHMHRFSMALDDVLDQIQDTVEKYMFMKGRKLPANTKKEFSKLAEQTLEAIRLTHKVVEKLFAGEEVFEDIKKITKIEGICDDIEKKIFKLIFFNKKINPITSRLIYGTTTDMAHITDTLEECGVHMTIIRLIRKA